MQLGILGAGTMGEIIARALLEREVFRPATTGPCPPEKPG